jgi:hypothetical protein
MTIKSKETRPKMLRRAYCLSNCSGRGGERWSIKYKRYRGKKIEKEGKLGRQINIKDRV